MRIPAYHRALLLALAALAPTVGRAQAIEWDGGAAGTGNSLSVVTNWNPDLAASADLTDKILRIATANFDPATVSTSSGIGNILIGTPPTLAGFEFDNSGGYYRQNFGVRLVPTTSTTTVTDRVLTFGTAGTLIKSTNSASSSIRRFGTNVGDGTGDIATVIVNLNYTGSGVIDLDATSTFLFQETKITGTGGITKTGPGTLTLDSGFFSSLSAPPNLAANPVYNGSTADSYSGGLAILGGMVSVDSVNRLPSATINNDGATPNPDAVVINGGTLRFTAGTLASSANRGFRVGAATGTLDITASNTRLSGSIRNVAGEDGVLIKTGAGNLSLEGATHSHSGGTRLQAGTLTLNGITLGAPDGQGLVTSAGTTLRGHGTIQGASTLATGTTIQPATYTANAATSPVGTLTFARDLTLGGVTLAYDLDAPSVSDLLLVGAGATLDIGAGALDLGSFSFTPGANFAPGVYTLIGTGSPILGTLGATLTGTVGGQPVSLGFSGDGTSLVLTVGVVSPLLAWRQENFGTTLDEGLAADAADPDDDGRPNLLEYALGGDPLLADAGPSPALAVASDRLTLTFQRVADPALTYTVQASNTLASDAWTSIWSSTQAANVAGPVTVTDTELLSASPRRFLRLLVAR